LRKNAAHFKNHAFPKAARAWENFFQVRLFFLIFLDFFPVYGIIVKLFEAVLQAAWSFQKAPCSAQN